MDAKQRRQKARQDKVFSELAEAKNEIVRLSRDLLAATERLQPVVEENEKKTKELHEARVSLRERTTAFARVDKEARDAKTSVQELMERIDEVLRENALLQQRLDEATKSAEKNAAAAKEVKKLRRRLANREPDPERIAANRKAATLQSL
jgi:regulator of replication initiation timing